SAGGHTVSQAKDPLPQHFTCWMARWFDFGWCVRLSVLWTWRSGYAFAMGNSHGALPGANRVLRPDGAEGKVSRVGSDRGGRLVWRTSGDLRFACTVVFVVLACLHRLCRTRHR